MPAFAEAARHWNADPSACQVAYLALDAGTHLGHAKSNVAGAIGGMRYGLVDNGLSMRPILEWRGPVQRRHGRGIHARRQRRTPLGATTRARLAQAAMSFGLYVSIATLPNAAGVVSISVHRVRVSASAPFRFRLATATLPRLAVPPITALASPRNETGLANKKQPPAVGRLLPWGRTPVGLEDRYPLRLFCQDHQRAYITTVDSWSKSRE